MVGLGGMWDLGWIEEGSTAEAVSARRGESECGYREEYSIIHLC